MVLGRLGYPVGQDRNKLKEQLSIIIEASILLDIVLANEGHLNPFRKGKSDSIVDLGFVSHTLACLQGLHPQYSPDNLL